MKKSIQLAIVASAFIALFHPFALPAQTIVYITQPLANQQENLFSLRNAIALIALIISVGSLLYNIHYQSQTRRNSINDEFWFRKVGYNLIIEPITHFFVETIENLPSKTDSSLLNDIFQSNQKFSNKFQENVESHRGRLLLLHAALPEASASLVHDKMITSLDKIEDIVVIYCHEIGISDTSVSKEETVQKIQREITAFLAPLRDWQHKPN